MERVNRASLRKTLEGIGVKSLAIEQIFKELDKKPPMFTSNLFVKVDEGILNRKLNFTQSTKDEENYFFNHYRAALVNKETGYMKETMVYINKSNNITQEELVKLLQGNSLERDICGKEGVYHGWMAIDTEEDKYGYPILRSYNDKFGYDLTGLLSSTKLLEVNDVTWRKEAEMKMRNGESATGSAEINGKIIPVVIKPFVRFKNFHFNHENGLPLTREERLQIMSGPDSQKNMKKEQGQGIDQKNDISKKVIVGKVPPLN